MPEAPDEFQEAFVSHGPPVSLGAGEECVARREALLEAVHAARLSGLQENCKKKSRDLVWGHVCNAP